ncbi:hypothetical protein B0T16DRAFT_461042 [Cercophora newfieldiana]|uniref:Uncharacterized protein n=1 Tax=Cercophora newfieldiana TaxID=92897 RepID=A0AA40CJ92_9PEZI|nr:hypothetical protein B0T16DRAFT_461042 [Cercophora newfieldiana]
MADPKSDSTTWFSVLSLVPPEYHYILHRISMFFVGLACVIITPIIGLIIYDLSLWFCRLLAGMVGNLRSPQQETVAPHAPLKDRASGPEKVASTLPENASKPRGSSEKTKLR